MPLRPELSELSVFAGDLLCRLSALLFVGAAIGIVIELARLNPALSLVAAAGMSSAFLGWLLARARFASPDEAKGRASLTTIIMILLFTSLFCTVVSWFA
jgi:hypothetical protein